MKKIKQVSIAYIPISFLKQYLFWICFFALNRIIFYLFNWPISKGESFIDMLKSFWYALHLDTSMVCYFLLIPFLILFVQSLFKVNFLNKVNKYFTYLIMLIVSLTYIGELGIYKEWNEKLSYKAISFLSNPDEVFLTAGVFQMVLGFIFLISLLFLGIFLYNKFFYKSFVVIKRRILFSVAWFLLIPGILVIGIRGGLQEMTISQGAVYFSKSNYVNLGTVNTVWNLIYSVLNNYKYKTTNPFQYYSFDEAQETVDKLYYTEKDTTEKILKTDKPNIVLIMLESWSADNVETLGGLKGITPNFNNLSKKGLLFTNNYSCGSLSHQALVSIYSGFPTTPEVDIIKHADKYENLNCFVKKLDNYETSFYYGAQLHHGNMKSYLYFNEFDNIIEEKDFSGNTKKGSLGVHDEELYNRLLKDIDNFKQPFYLGAFTLSSHSPYDIPMEDIIEGYDNYDEYLNSVYYADKCLGEFFEEAEKQAWYDNTLFILLADHGHGSPSNWGYYSVEKRKTPLLFFGNVLKEEYRGKTNAKLSNQTDLSATILAQLNIDYSDLRWSRNLLNPYSKDFTYYAFDDGFGYIEPGSYMIYNERDNMGIIDYRAESEEHKEELLKIGKSYMQILFQEYLDY